MRPLPDPMTVLDRAPRKSALFAAFSACFIGSPLYAEVVASADSSQFAPVLPANGMTSADSQGSAPEGDDAGGNRALDADGENDIEEEDGIFTEESLREGFGQFVESRDNLSRRLFRLGLGIDRYFAGRVGLDEPNETYARMRLAQTWLEGEGLVNDSDIKFKLDLPSTKKKYRLIFENDTENDTLVDQRGNPTGLSDANLDRESLSAAVRLAVRDMENWHSDFDVGIRGSIPLDPFVRHNLKRTWELGSDWNFRMRQRIGYFHSKGYTYNMQWGFDRFLEPDLSARYITELEWEQPDDELKFGQAFAVTRFLNERQLLDHSVGIAGHSWSTGLVDLYYVAITHRTLLYKDWLTLDLVPEIRFPRENHFENTLAFTVRLEVLFFENNPFRR